MCFSSWVPIGVNSTAGRYEGVFLLLSSRYYWSVLFPLVLFLLLAVGDFLCGWFLLFDSVALISVDHPHGRV